MAAFNLNRPAEVLTEEEKLSITTTAKDTYKESIKSRRSEAAVVYDVVLDGTFPNSCSVYENFIQPNLRQKHQGVALAVRNVKEK
jgi:hypothetical protein